MMIVRESIKHILVIKLGGLGDVFLSTIVIDNLLAHFSSACLDYFVDKQGKEAIIHDKRVRSVFVLDKDVSNPLRVIREVRKGKYDLVVDLFGNPRSGIITYLSGAAFRVGLDYGWRKHLYSIVGTVDRANMHGAEVNLQALNAMKIPIMSRSVRFPLSYEDVKYADEFWSKNDLHGKFVVSLLPAGSWPSKKCEPEKFAEIASVIAARYSATIIIVWGPTDEREAIEIKERTPDAILAPKATLSQNLSLLERGSATIANDSGPMHLASGFSTPILCLYGPTFPDGPYGTIHSWVRHEGLDCLVCNHLQCPIQHQCMRDLPIGSVLAAFDAMISKAGIRRN